MVAYFILVNLYSFVLFTLYLLLLRNRPHQRWSRFYLLSTLLLSAMLPLVKADIPIAGITPAATTAQLLPELILAAGPAITATNGTDWIFVLYILGCSSLLLLFLLRIFHMTLFLRKHKFQDKQGYRIALNTGIGPASFGHIIIFPGTEIKPEILQHEQAHCSYRHHYDKLFVSLMLCFFFPVIAYYFIKKELETVHEFEADALAVQDADHYARLLINQHFHTRHFTPFQSFFHHPIKRRIKMLYKNKTNGLRRKGLLILLSATWLTGAILLQSQSKLMAQDKTKKDKESGSDAKSITREHIRATGTDQIYYQEKEDGQLMVADAQGKKDSKEIYTSVEQMPEFPGGIDSLMAYLAGHIRYPEAAKKDKLEGRVIGQFVVNEAGKVEQVKIIRGLNADFDAETIRVIGSMPDWTPGRQHGKNVSVYFTLPITFKLD